uniref:Uncharacterized protein LOC8262865 n=1 Tax=Rhizophora mucronata TaxID=61149 RepID=A0A2P2JCN1_RHIMU
MVKSGSSQNLSPQTEVEFERSVPVSLPQQQLGYDFQQAGMSVSAPTPQFQAYMGPNAEITNLTDYIHLCPQKGFPNTQLFSTAGSVFTQQHIHNGSTGVSPRWFVPAAHTNITPPSSQVSVRPALVQPVMQPQPRVEHYLDESTVGAQIVQLPLDPSYNISQARNPPMASGGGYGWHQVPQPDHVALSDGSVAHRQVIFPEKIHRLEDCFMCQKALPHAHSDPSVQDQRESGVNPLFDSNLVHQNLQFEGTLKARPMNRIMESGALRDNDIEQGAGSRTVAVSHVDHQIPVPESNANAFSKNHDALQENETIAFWKMDISDQPKISVPHAEMGLPAGVHAPLGVFVAAVPHAHQEGLMQQPSTPIQCQYKQEAVMNKTVNSEVPNVFGLPPQASEHLVHESPNGKLTPIGSKEDIVNLCVSPEQLKPFDRMMETLQICPSEINVHPEQMKSTVGKFRKEEIPDHVTQQMAGRDVFLDDTSSKSQLVLDSSHIKQIEVLPASAELSYSSQLMAASDITQSSILCNPGPYLQSKIGNQLLDSTSLTCSGVEPAYVVDRIPPIGFKNDASNLQPKLVPNEVEVAPSANTAYTLSPLFGVGDFQDSSYSLLSSDDPWNLRHDTNFPPPSPSNILTKKAFAIKHPGTNHLGDPANFITNISEDGFPQSVNNSNRDSTLENAQSSKGPAEELIKQELQAVATSVFQLESTIQESNESPYESDPGKEVSNKEVELQHKAKLEELKKKLPEKVNFRFSVSEGIGRLQVIKNSDLEELRELGSGTFGTVYHGKWRGTDVAIKRINNRCFAGKSSEQERMIDDFWNEAINLADLHHPNVVAFYGVVLDGPGGSVATVTEFMVNGSLRNALQKNERNLDKRKRLLIAMDVAFGMEYLHEKNIVHFDLKSDNLLVNLRDTHRPICKVGDLGLSKVKCQTLISGGVRGTLPWMAPELLNGSSSLVSEKVDVFSFGIVLWELLTGEEPYADLHYGAIIGGIVSNTLRPQVPESCDADWKSLMERCWSPEPSERPSFTEIANDLRTMSAKIPPRGQSQAQ